MELYKKFPRFCIFWCCVEIVCFAGLMFGWNALLFVLKLEGFYSTECFQSDADFNKSTAFVYSSTDNTNEITNPNVSFVSDLVSANGHSWLTKDEKGYLMECMQNIEDEHTAKTGETSDTNSKTNEDNEVSSKDIQNECAKAIEKYKLKQASVIAVLPDNSDILKGCAKQDSKLNLWFSISICFSYVMCSTLGPIIHRIGMRLFRVFYMVLFIIGCFCLGFANPVVPWLICPGLCFVGLSGMALYTSNIQVSFLFPTVQSTITSLFVGLFDASTVFTQIIKIAFENGIPRKYSFIAIAGFHAVLVGVSTCFFLPSDRLDPRAMKVKEKTKASDVQKHSEMEKFIRREEDQTSVFRTIFSAQYLLHVYWMCVHAIRFVTFLGFMNIWLETSFNGNKTKESHYLSIFSYVTMGTSISAITAGLLHDSQRRKYLNDSDFRRCRMPIILPLVLTTLMSVLITAFTLISNDSLLYVTFILFTIYRSYLFSFEATYINDIFSLRLFTLLFGILHSSAGLSGMMQYPLFEWYEAYDTAPNHVQLFLIILEISTLLHPLHLWYTCRKHKGEKSSFELNKEIYI